MTTGITEAPAQVARPEAQAPTWEPPPVVAEMWLTLLRAVRVLDELQRPVACSVAPERWWSAPTSVEAREAAELCTRCPVLHMCRAYALEAAEVYGVWGGTTPAERHRARRAVA